MSKREHASGLIGLRSKLPMPAPAEPVVPIEQIEKLFLAANEAEANPHHHPEVTQESTPDGKLDIRTSIQQDGTQEVRLPILLKRKRKTYTTTFTLRLPVETHKRLKKISREHDIGMTEIILAMVDRLLPELEQHHS